MADHAFGLIALSVLPQGSGAGTVNATIAALTDTVTHFNGLVVGVGDAGDGNSGITLPTHAREGLEAARIGNSAVADSFLREVPTGLKIKFPLAGSRTAASGTPADSDFNLATTFPGFDALLRAAGLTGAADSSGTAGHAYTPSGNVTYCSIGLHFGGLFVVYMDCLAELEFDLTPGKIGTVEASITIGSVYNWYSSGRVLATVTKNSGSTGTAQEVAAPVVKSAANAWGVTRPFKALTINVSPLAEVGEDSNSTTGFRTEQNGIDISFKTTIYAATSNPDYERDEMVDTSPDGDDMSFQVNGPTAGSAQCNGYFFVLANAIPRTNKPVKIGNQLGWEVEGECKAITTAGTEFTFELY